MCPEDVVARARAAVGAPFRPQGRSARQGLDCVGLAGLALGLQGLPTGYRLRSSDSARASAALEKVGLAKIAPKLAGAGDLLLVAPALTQLHLLVLTKGGFVHADASLRRVVEVPGPVPWRIVSAWRWGSTGKES
jgi:hypothetical protein